jgi:hypothetical protein
MSTSTLEPSDIRKKKTYFEFLEFHNIQFLSLHEKMQQIQHIHHVVNMVYITKIVIFTRVELWCMSFVRECLSTNRYKSCHQLISKKVQEKFNVQCDINENEKDDQGLFTVLLAIMHCFELRAKFLNSNLFFHQY